MVKMLPLDDKLINMPRLINNKYQSPLKDYWARSTDVVYINKEGNVSVFFPNRADYRAGLIKHKKILKHHPGLVLVNSWDTNPTKYDSINYYLEIAYPYFLNY